MTAICPHCGFDIQQDQPIIINSYGMLNANSDLRWLGLPVPLTASERTVCWSLMKAYPKHITHAVILERLGSEAEGNVVDVYLSRIRKKLRALGAPIPFKAVRLRENQGRATVWDPL